MLIERTNEPRRLVLNALPGFFLVFVMALAFMGQEFSGKSWHLWGVLPRTTSGLVGIITSPFVHADGEHLFANSLPFIVLSWLIFTSHRAIAFELLLWFWLLTGIWTWCLGRPSYHIGASGIVYAQMSFLFFSGVWRRDSRSVALSMLIVVLYGGFIWGIVPLVNSHISWEAHLAGFLAGLMLSWHFRKKDAPAKYKWPEEHYETEFWLPQPDITEIQDLEAVEEIMPTAPSSDVLLAPFNAQPVVPRPIIVVRYVFVPKTPEH